MSAAGPNMEINEPNLNSSAVVNTVNPPTPTQDASAGDQPAAEEQDKSIRPRKTTRYNFRSSGPPNHQ